MARTIYVVDDVEHTIEQQSTGRHSTLTVHIPTMSQAVFTLTP